MLTAGLVSAMDLERCLSSGREKLTLVSVTEVETERGRSNAGRGSC
jgi:hypothetical protein